MSTSDVMIFCVAACVLMTSLVSGRRQHAADTEERHVTGVAGKTVVLRCDLPTSNPPTVRWIDYVYNSGPAPELIYASGQVQWSHPHADEFRVDSEFNMTISSLRQDVSPGQYICQSDVGGRIHQLVYQLTVCSMLLSCPVAVINSYCYGIIVNSVASIPIADGLNLRPVKNRRNIFECLSIAFIVLIYLVLQCFIVSFVSCAIQIYC